MSNEQIIWNFLMNDIKNPYGVAGLMGNLYAESRLDPGLLEGKYRTKFGMSSEQYTNAVDNGTYTNFVHDSVGYGLVQWTYWSRKESFLNFMKSKGVSISNLNAQLEFLVDEIKKYKAVYSTLLTAKSVKEASDIVMAKYERNANQSESNKLKRASFGETYYDKFHGKDPEPVPVPTGKKYVETTDRSVNVRIGNGLNYKAITQIPNKGTRYEYVATAINGWNAIVINNQVGWIMGDFSKVVEA